METINAGSANVSISYPGTLTLNGPITATSGTLSIVGGGVLAVDGSLAALGNINISGVPSAVLDLFGTSSFTAGAGANTHFGGPPNTNVFYLTAPKFVHI